MYSLSIVIPAYNEETRLPPTLDSILAYVREKSLAWIEIIVVNDGSYDGTAALVQTYSRREPVVKLLCNSENRGKGYAVRKGMLAARGDWILISDADLSSPIAELDKLLAAAQERNAFVAIGSRALNRSLVETHQNAFREYAGRFFNLVVRLVAGLPFRDTQCGFKLYRSEAARQIFSRQRLDGFSFDVEDLVIARICGFKAVEVPVRWSNVRDSKVRMKDGLKSFLDVLRIRYYERAGKYGQAVTGEK